MRAVALAGAWAPMRCALSTADARNRAGRRLTIAVGGRLPAARQTIRLFAQLGRGRPVRHRAGVAHARTMAVICAADLTAPIVSRRTTSATEALARSVSKCACDNGGLLAGCFGKLCFHTIRYETGSTVIGRASFAAICLEEGKNGHQGGLVSTVGDRGE